MGRESGEMRSTSGNEGAVSERLVLLLGLAVIVLAAVALDVALSLLLVR